jgi:hypothetical protein
LKITLLKLKQLIKKELQNILKEAGDPRFLSRSRHMPPRSIGSRQTSLGPETLKRRAPGEPVRGEHGQEEVLVWYDGNWHETVITDEEASEIAAAHDPDVESWGDAAQRVLSSLRGLDIEDVDLS